MKSSRHNFVLMIFYWNRTVKLWKFSHSTVITLRFCILVIILWKLDHLLLSYRQKRCFSIWHPYAILNLKIGILGKSLLSRVTAWFSVANFVIIRSFFTDIRQHNDFHIIGRAPCWRLCTASSNWFLWSRHRPKFSRWLVWQFTCELHLCAVGNRETDRQTDYIA